MTQPFFSAQGRVLVVNGNAVQIFEYAGDAEAQAQADLVSPSGASIGTSMVSWTGTPHFFKRGKLIALYVGEDENTLNALRQTLGEQFAGG